MSPRIFVRGLALLSLGITSLAAQDFSVTPPTWLYESDNPDQMPRRGTPRTPDEIPDALKTLSRPTYARIRELLGEDGAPLSRNIVSELPWLSSPAAELFMRSSRPKPATRAGKPVVCEIEYFLVFNPAAAAGVARLVQPVSLPLPEADAEASHAFVAFEFTVDADGHATAARALQDSISKPFVQAVQKSLPRWQFAPAHIKGAASVSHVQLPVLFVSEPPMVPTAPDAASAVIYREPPRYPQAARLQGVPGNVTIAAVIDVEGRVRDPKVIQSSDRIFERPAVVAMNRWRFRPARANGLPVRSKIVQEFSFSMRDSGAPGLLWVRKEPEKLKHLPPSLQWDTAPEYERIQAAVYPYEALAMKKEGVVRLAFIVGPQGRVVESKVTSTSDPVFAGAALAMVETYRFIPAGKAGQPSSALLSLEVKFSLHGNALVPNEEDTREIIRRLEHDRSSFVRPQDLDTKLSARTPPNAAFPLGVKATNGEAVIEFVVDREGIVQAPRVVSATEPAFGYAAAQAVANMRFDAPLKDGKAVDVIIRQPLKFRRAD